MLAIVLGMLIVVGGVLFFRLHAFLALFFATLVVAAATASYCVRESALDNHAANIVALADQQVELAAVGDEFKSQPGAYYIVSGEEDLPQLDAQSVWIEQFDASTATLRENLAESPRLPARLISQHDYDQAVKLSETSATSRVADALGKTFGKIGVLIAMASIIGQCLLTSGAAERIVQTIRQALGQRWTTLAFVISSFILAIPVFFDTVFFLMLPLAQAMARRTGRDYLKYVMSIIVGGTLAHSLVPPTPGPLFVASELNVSIGAMAIGGIAVGIWGVFAGYIYMLWANRRWQIPLRFDEAEQVTDAAPPNDSRLPSFGLSILPVVIPIILLALLTFYKAAKPDFGSALTPVLDTAIPFLGDKNIALSLGALLAMLTLILKPKTTWVELGKSVQKALAEGGVVILITCAGGAFGEMIRQTDVGATIANLMPSSVSGSGLLAMAFLVTLTIRVIQGSATVAMIAAIGIVVPLATQIGLPFHPVYLALAIGCGSKPLPWMNDSGFWVISRMSGFTEKETLQTFSVLLTIMGIASFLATLLAAYLFPLA
ncbi:GntP family permease [Blastopirellula retiformator]|uniref:Inner membrane permease YgbN n=1 Tax=Blastopirellula retiformator TaxID=2527970 RepID=A0A5C5V833_9BACT|nr:SLC13 family permease [Blastopirellula retiformator]TWT34726.1 Inner membrane permease YgbN [Blastopirellula retiformator]